MITVFRLNDLSGNYFTILLRNSVIEQLKQAFHGQDTFSRDALHRFYLQFDPELKDATFRWRIYNLKEQNLIRPISRNEFTFTYKPFFTPEIGEGEQKLFSLVEKGFKELKKAVFSTRIINEFMLHQPVRYFTLVEVEKAAIESVFFYLKDRGIRNIFLQPEEKALQWYVSELDNAIILQSLVSKAPLQKLRKIGTTTLEKLLVDLYCDKKLFYTYQGAELSFIINNAYRRYSIDFTKLFSYAKRRNRETDLREFLSDKTEIPKTILNDR
ncbi:MAG: DUF6577 family protein [Flavisolibacter sp.]